MSFVPSSVKLPPQLKDISSSVIGRRQATIYPATGSIDYSASNRLITFNISSEPSLLDTDKLYFEFDAVITKQYNAASPALSDFVIPNNSAESYIDRLVLRVGSKVICDTGYGYQMAESMMHHWQQQDFSCSSGHIMGISSIDPKDGLSGATITVGTGAITADGNNTYASRGARYLAMTGTATDNILQTSGANGLTSRAFACKFIVPLRLCGFLDGLTNLVPLWVLDSAISLSLDIYLSSNAQVMASIGTNGAAGAIATAPSYVLQNCLLSADYVDVSEDYKNSINSFLASGNSIGIPSSEFNIYQFAVSAGASEQSFQLSAVYKDLEAIYISWFQNLNSFAFNGEDQLTNPNIGTIQLQVGSKYFPSDQPLDCSGRAVRAFQQTAKAFNPNGIEAGFSFPADAYKVEYRDTGTGTAIMNRAETKTYFVVGFPFESLLDEDDSTLTGLDTSVGSGIVTIRVKSSSTFVASTMVVVCKYKQQVSVSQNYLVDRML